MLPPPIFPSLVALPFSLLFSLPFSLPFSFLALVSRLWSPGSGLLALALTQSNSLNQPNPSNWLGDDAIFVPFSVAHSLPFIVGSCRKKKVVRVCTSFKLSFFSKKTLTKQKKTLINQIPQGKIL